MGNDVINPLITHDPVRGKELLVTRLESPENGIVIEGKFSLGWMGRLTPYQLEFAGYLIKNRGNIQKLAAEMNIAYNTARNHLDEIVAALEGKPVQAVREPSEKPAQAAKTAIMNRLSAGEINFDEAMQLLKEL